MKVLCRLDGGGSMFVRQGWGKAFKLAGHDFRFWNPDSKSLFDVFHDFTPDLFISTTYSVDRAFCKLVEANPAMKVILFASAWGDYVDNIDHQKYPIVMVQDGEKRILEELKKKTGKPDFVFIHVTDKFREPTMGGWRTIGIEPVGILNAADVLDYLPGTPKENLKSDIVFVGGYWPYKARNINNFLLPLCHPSKNLNVKIFGNQPWPVPNYLGQISTPDVRNAFASAIVCPSVSESHSTDLGFDIVERPFKVLASNAFCIADYVEEAREIFNPEELIMCSHDWEYHERIQEFIRFPDTRLPYINAGRKCVLSKHTYFHRVAQMFTQLNLPDEAAKVLNAYQNWLKLQPASYTEGVLCD